MERSWSAPGAARRGQSWPCRLPQVKCFPQLCFASRQPRGWNQHQDTRTGARDTHSGTESCPFLSHPRAGGPRGQARGPRRRLRRRKCRVRRGHGGAAAVRRDKSRLRQHRATSRCARCWEVRDKGVNKGVGREGFVLSPRKRDLERDGHQKFSHLFLGGCSWGVSDRPRPSVHQLVPQAEHRASSGVGTPGDTSHSHSSGSCECHSLGLTSPSAGQGTQSRA